MGDEGVRALDHEFMPALGSQVKFSAVVVLDPVIQGEVAGAAREVFEAVAKVQFCVAKEGRHDRFRSPLFEKYKLLRISSIPTLSAHL
jgi:hypothetical protein